MVSDSPLVVGLDLLEGLPLCFILSVKLFLGLESARVVVLELLLVVLLLLLQSFLVLGDDFLLVLLEVFNLLFLEVSLLLIEGSFTAKLKLLLHVFITECLVL